MGARPLHEIAEDLVKLSEDEDERHYYAEDFTPLFQELGYAASVERRIRQTLADLYVAGCAHIHDETFIVTGNLTQHRFINEVVKTGRFINRHGV